MADQVRVYNTVKISNIEQLINIDSVVKQTHDIDQEAINSRNE